jgi:hypothetical protein
MPLLQVGSLSQISSHPMTLAATAASIHQPNYINAVMYDGPADNASMAPLTVSQPQGYGHRTAGQLPSPIYSPQTSEPIFQWSSRQAHKMPMLPSTFRHTWKLRVNLSRGRLDPPSSTQSSKELRIRLVCRLIFNRRRKFSQLQTGRLKLHLMDPPTVTDTGRGDPVPQNERNLFLIRSSMRKANLNQPNPTNKQTLLNSRVTVP